MSENHLWPTVDFIQPSVQVLLVANEHLHIYIYMPQIWITNTKRLIVIIHHYAVCHQITALPWFWDESMTNPPGKVATSNISHVIPTPESFLRPRRFGSHTVCFWKRNYLPFMLEIARISDSHVRPFFFVLGFCWRAQAFQGKCHSHWDDQVSHMTSWWFWRKVPSV